jgi:putative ABC transport system permease protein
MPSPYFLVRTQSEPLAMAETLRHAIHRIDPARSVFDISPLKEHLSNSFAEDRLRTELLTLFALTAVSLVCVGLYGTLSYFVTVRRREVGLRMALGALRAQIVTHFLWKGIAVSMTGCVVGLCFAAVFARGLSGMLYGVSTLDPESFLVVACLIFAVAAAASLAPSIRAAHLEPMQVLRDE